MRARRPEWPTGKWLQPFIVFDTLKTMNSAMDRFYR